MRKLYSCSRKRLEISNSKNGISKVLWTWPLPWQTSYKCTYIHKLFTFFISPSSTTFSSFYTVNRTESTLLIFVIKGTNVLNDILQILFSFFKYKPVWIKATSIIKYGNSGNSITFACLRLFFYSHSTLRCACRIVCSVSYFF